MTTIAIDGLSEEEFRRSIESNLRRGRAGEAVERLRQLLEPYAAPGGILPERFLSVTSGDLLINGWEGLAEAVRRHDRPGRPVTAVSVAFAWPGEEMPQPDAEGRLAPLVEASYFNDDAFPFSQSGREDLLDGYSLHGCTWADDCEASDRTLWVTGIDDLHGALAQLEAHLLDSEEPDPEEICAGSLGACLLSALLIQAVGERIERDGLPRPLCVMAGSNGVYPYFDAPVVGMPLEVLKANSWADDDISALDTGVPGPRYSSLLVTGIRRAPKRAVLVLEESEADMAVRIAALRGHGHGGGDAAAPRPAPHDGNDAPRLPDPAIAAAPGGPLLAKKPVHGEGWDFRDMLSPRPSAPRQTPQIVPTPTPRELSPRELSPVKKAPVIQAPAEPEPVEPLPAAPLVPEPLAEPGFTLIEPRPAETTVQARLQSLLAPHLPDAFVEAEPEAEPEPEAVPEPAAADLHPAPAAHVDWPLGLGWLEETDSTLPLPFADEPPAPPSLWARLRGWLRRGQPG